MTLPNVSDLVVRGVLIEELDGRDVDLELVAQAPAAALELLKVDRASWPAPRDSWETLVASTAAAIHRLRVRGIPDADLLLAIERALASVANAAGAAS